MAAGCSSGAPSGAPSTSAPPLTSSPPPPSSSTATSTTSTTVDPGSLPQTAALPSGSDPAFLARMGDLVRAITSGQPSLAAPAFFPLGAYIQVKGISDPVHDYQTRLIPNYDQDIESLHSSVGAGAVLQSVTVPDAAEWIKPGVEYNKGSYWRVYGTRVTYSTGGRQGSFTIASMISWRGEWYVVHLLSIR